MTQDCTPCKVCVVGSSTTFLSGISYYTYFLALSLTDTHSVSCLLLKNLIPKRLYPGGSRVGQKLSTLDTASFCPTFDGINWYGVPSILQACLFLYRRRPDTIILEWWTASAFPWYLIIIGFGRLLKAQVILELHEEIDTGEAAIPIVGPHLRGLLRVLCRLSNEIVVHSEWDRVRMSESLNLEPEQLTVIRHGPYDLARADGGEGSKTQALEPVGGAATIAPSPDVYETGKTLNLLFFGTIRPYKGVEYLVDAFDRLPREQLRWHLDIVGERWEGWSPPFERIVDSVYESAITLVDRYVADEEVPGYFDKADIVVLPYLRSSASGPLHIAMSLGLPVVVTAVGGLVEAVQNYPNAVLVQPESADELCSGIKRAAEMRPCVADPYKWSDVADSFGALFARRK